MIRFKNYLSIIFLGLIKLNSSAQDVSYRILRDEPSKIAPLIIHADLFYADTWGTNVTLGYGIRLGYELKDKASFNFDWRTSYLDQNAKTYPGSGLKNFQFWEVDGEYHFIDKEKSGSLKVVLSSSSSGSYTYTKYIMVPAHYRKVRALRFGIQHIRTPFKVQESKLTAGSYDIKGYSGNDIKEFEQWESTRSMMNITAINAGISVKNITNLLIQTGRKKANAAINNVYLEYLYAPIISFSNVTTADAKEWELRSDKLKRSGWRLGWCCKSSSRSAVGFKFEFGSRPGFYGSSKGVTGANLFLMMNLGWTIPIKLKE